MADFSKSFENLSGRDAAILLGRSTALEVAEKIKGGCDIDEAGETGAAVVGDLLNEAQERGFDADSFAVIESFAMTLCEELGWCVRACREEVRRG